MLDRIGVRTEIHKVPDESFFRDHIASGEYDLALYSWPGTAFPATDGRPIHAKPEPAADGSLLVEQNYTRVGTDHIDQLFERAAAELDEEAARDLLHRADARIWAAAGSIPSSSGPSSSPSAGTSSTRAPSASRRRATRTSGSPRRRRRRGEASANRCEDRPVALPGGPRGGHDRRPGDRLRGSPVPWTEPWRVRPAGVLRKTRRRTHDPREAPATHAHAPRHP